MSQITTHVLDTALGRAAAGVRVTLEQRTAPGGWVELARGETDTDGRVADLGPQIVTAGRYRLLFDTAEYLERTGQPVFFPEVTLVFEIAADAGHHHVPLLLSPFGFSSYRGT